MSATIEEGPDPRLLAGPTTPSAVRSFYVVRPATTAEREAVASSWRTLCKLPRDSKDMDAGQLLVQVGHYDLGRDWLRLAINTAIDDALEGVVRVQGPCAVLVADHPDAPGYPLGWAAFDREPRQLLALHVQANSRKAWVGRTLLRHVLDLLGADVPSALMTASGRRLLGHVRASIGSTAWNAGGGFAQNERILPDGRIEVAR